MSSACSATAASAGYMENCWNDWRDEKKTGMRLSLVLKPESGDPRHLSPQDRRAAKRRCGFTGPPREYHAGPDRRRVRRADRHRVGPHLPEEFPLSKRTELVPW